MDFIQNIDNAVTSFIFQNWHGNDVINHILGVFTRLGSAGIIWVLFFVGIFVYTAFKEKRISVFAIGGIIVLGLGFVLNDYVFKKIFFNVLGFRERPCQMGAGALTAEEIQNYLNTYSLTIKTGGSFPSGHSFSSFNCAVYIMLTHKKLGFATLPIALVIAFSRVFIGVHFLGDVLVGAILGTGFGIGMYFATKAIYKAAHWGDPEKSFYATR